MTRHMVQRMNQRGINGDLVALVSLFGEWCDDRLVLDRKSIQRAVRELDDLRGTMMKAMDKGGLAVVDVGGHQITTYGLRKGRK